MSPGDRDLLARVRKQLRENEAAIRAGRDQTRRSRSKMEQSTRVAEAALRQLRSAGVLR